MLEGVKVKKFQDRVSGLVPISQLQLSQMVQDPVGIPSFQLLEESGITEITIHNFSTQLLPYTHNLDIEVHSTHHMGAARLPRTLLAAGKLLSTFINSQTA